MRNVDSKPGQGHWRDATYLQIQAVLLRQRLFDFMQLSLSFDNIFLQIGYWRFVVRWRATRFEKSIMKWTINMMTVRASPPQTMAISHIATEDDKKSQSYRRVATDVTAIT